MTAENWKALAAAVVAALIGAGGTLGAQKIAPSSPVASASQQLQLVEGMTGLCIRVERTGTAK